MLQYFTYIAYADDWALWFRLAPNHVDEDRKRQVLEVIFQGDESCRQHIHAIRLDNVRHSEADARQAEQSALRAQEALNEFVQNAWSARSMQSTSRVNALVRQAEERARYAREVARWAFDAHISPRLAG